MLNPAMLHREESARQSPIGIRRIEALTYYVRHLDRTRRFLTDQLDFAEIGASSAEMEQEEGQRAAVVRAGECAFILVEPLGEGGAAWRFLRKHPEGMGALTFEVEDAARAFSLIEERGGTPITDVQRFRDDGGELASFSIITPFGDTTFRFVERRGYDALFPGYVAHPAPRGGNNGFRFNAVDHVATNFQTMAPALLWMEHVLGFERYWEVKFHTRDVAAEEAERGSGLKSIVMWDPGSGVKLANNEPYRPFFRESQINVFAEDHRGEGVQHAALATDDIIATVRGLRARGVEFMPTPGAYYDLLPERLSRLGVGSIDEDVATLRDLEILVDGGAPKSYLLQVFLKESAGLYKDPEAGPFFFEIIQRKGDKGFGAGNFRALFESIERAQRAAGRI